MNLFNVAAELATSLATISSPALRVYPHPPDALVAPAAIVGYPESVNFDVSMGRGTDMVTIPVHVVMDRNWDRATAEQFSAVTSGSGTSSVKQVLQAGTHTAFSACRVRSCSFSVISVAGLEYWAATFLVDIYGPGA